MPANDRWAAGDQIGETGSSARWCHDMASELGMSVSTRTPAARSRAISWPTTAFSPDGSADR